MNHLITDRTEKDVHRWRELRDKGWAAMTAEEQAEWMGDPIAAAKAGKVVNLLNFVPVELNATSAKQDGDSITLTALTTGNYRNVRVNLGPAEKFVNQYITVSCASAEMEFASSFATTVYWADSGMNYTYVEGSRLRAPGTVTFKCNNNPDNRKYLAMYIYVASEEPKNAGTTITYNKLMVELGSTAHPYVPYSPIAPTSAVKGMYGHTDMNRVEKTVADLSEKMSALQYPYSPDVKTDWSREDIPTKDDMLRYYGNIVGIRSAIPVYSTTPIAPNIGHRLNYSMANDIEKILVDIDRITDSIPKSWHFAGEINSGEV